jgi:hypothetical protein
MAQVVDYALNLYAPDRVASKIHKEWREKDRATILMGEFNTSFKCWRGFVLFAVLRINTVLCM